MDLVVPNAPKLLAEVELIEPYLFDLLPTYIFIRLDDFI